MGSINVNCIYNDKGAWCNNTNVKRSLCGFGARCCTEYGKLNSYKCIWRESLPKPCTMKEKTNVK